MAENFQIWQKMYLQTQDSEKTPNRINSKKSSPGHVVGKPLNTKEKKNLEGNERERTLIYGGKKSLKWQQIFHQKQGRPGEKTQHLSKLKELSTHWSSLVTQWVKDSVLSLLWHCCGIGLIPDLGTSAWHRHSLSNYQWHFSQN